MDFVIEIVLIDGRLFANMAGIARLAGDNYPDWSTTTILTG